MMMCMGMFGTGPVEACSDALFMQLSMFQSQWTTLSECKSI